MPWVRSHRRSTGLFSRSTRVRSHYRRPARRLPVVPIAVGVVVLLVLLVLISLF